MFKRRYLCDPLQEGRWRTACCKPVWRLPAEKNCTQPRHWFEHGDGRPRPDASWKHCPGRCESHVGGTDRRLGTEPLRTPGLCEQLQGFVSGARPNLNTAEAQDWDILITKFLDVFATNGDDCEWTDKASHRIHSGDALLVRQPPHRQPLAKEAEL